MAFSVSLSSSNGPHSGLHTLIYKHIFLNTGDVHDANTGTVNHFIYCKVILLKLKGAFSLLKRFVSDTGIFTTPMKGVYSGFSQSQGKGVSAGLFKNGQHEISTYAQGMKFVWISILTSGFLTVITTTAPLVDICFIPCEQNIHNFFLN